MRLAVRHVSPLALLGIVAIGACTPPPASSPSPQAASNRSRRRSTDWSNATLVGKWCSRPGWEMPHRAETSRNDVPRYPSSMNTPMAWSMISPRRIRPLAYPGSVGVSSILQTIPTKWLGLCVRDPEGFHRRVMCCPTIVRRVIPATHRDLVERALPAVLSTLLARCDVVFDSVCGLPYTGI